MKVILEVESGPDAPRSFVIEPGVNVEIGRTPPAHILLANDRTVSRRHFAVSFDGMICRIKDLGSTHGTTVNGRRVSEACVVDGDLIAAGTSVLRVMLSDELSTEASDLALMEPPVELPATVFESLETQERDARELTLHDRVLELLRSQKQPLYAILDAARDPMVYLRITECPERKQSLYEGPEADRLAFFAPYLITLPRQSSFLEQLVREGWGKSWGVYLTSDKPFDEVRKHLRRFLTVELEGKKEKVLFRFYDPRVLRVFLPTCTSEELLQFFGPIRELLMEDSSPESAFRFQYHRQGLREESIRLTAPSPPSPWDTTRSTTA
jgi:pSer/pThr/pTyr-binding forkhead associated (FHA) protein